MADPEREQQTIFGPEFQALSEEEKKKVLGEMLDHRVENDPIWKAGKRVYKWLLPKDDNILDQNTAPTATPVNYNPGVTPGVPVGYPAIPMGVPATPVRKPLLVGPPVPEDFKYSSNPGTSTSTVPQPPSSPSQGTLLQEHLNDPDAESKLRGEPSNYSRARDKALGNVIPSIPNRVSVDPEETPAQPNVEFSKNVDALPPPVLPGRVAAIENAYEIQQDALKKAGDIGKEKAVSEAAYFQELSRQAEERFRDQEQKNKEVQGKMSIAIKDIQNTQEEFGRMKVNPNRYFENQSTGDKILQAVSIVLGGFGGALTKQGNMALAIIQNNIDRDIQAQKEEIAGKDKLIASKLNLFGRLREQFNDGLAADAAARVLYNDQIIKEIQSRASMFESADVQQKANLAIAKLEEEKQKNMLSLETAFRTVGPVSTGNVVNDQIVTRVPEKQRAQAYKEFGYLDEYKRSVSSVSDSFDTLRDLPAWSKWIPLTESKARADAAEASIISVVQANWKGPMSDQDVKMVKGIFPSVSDTKAQTDAKKERLLKIMEGNRKPTPVLNLYNIIHPIQEIPQSKGEQPRQSASELLESTVKDKNVRNGWKILIKRASTKYDVPEELITSLLHTESRFNVGALSPKGARGVAQIMPATAKQYGINPLNPDEAVDTAAKILRENLNEFKGDVGLAVRAYNAGNENVRKMIQAGRRSYNEGVEARKENEKYVKEVLGKAGYQDGQIFE